MVARGKGWTGSDESAEKENADTSERMEKITSEMLYELGALKASVNALELKKAPIPESSEYSIGGFSFNSLEDAKLFLSEGGPSGTDPGYYFDCFSVGTLSALKDKSLEETMKLKSLTMNSGMPDSINACGVLLSFSCDRASIVGVSAENVSREFPLPRVKTFDDWYLPSATSGTKTIMSRYDDTHELLEKHLAGFADMVRIQPKLAPLVAIATEMLSRSKKFIQEISRRVESFRNMVLAEHASHQEAWLLILEMLSAVFFEINKARTPFGDSITCHADPTHRCALVLVGTFRAHAKMEEIWKAGFAKHPCVSTCLLLHLFARKASANRIMEHERRLDDQDTKIKALQKTVQSQLDQVKRMMEGKGAAAKKPAV